LVVSTNQVFSTYYSRTLTKKELDDFQVMYHRGNTISYLKENVNLEKSFRSRVNHAFGGEKQLKAEQNQAFRI